MADQKTPWVRDLGREQPGGPILIVHGGMSDESPWLRVGEVLAERFHVALIRRRLYRLDVSVAVGTAMADQVAEVLAVAAGLGTQCVIVGHSSGAIVALEALVADPGLFAGAVLYEPPSPLPALPLGEPTTVDRCRKALSERGWDGRCRSSCARVSAFRGRQVRWLRRWLCCPLCAAM